MTENEPEAMAEAVVAADTDEPYVAIARVIDGPQPAESIDEEITEMHLRRGRAPRAPRGGSRRERQKTRHLVTARNTATKKNPAPTDEEVLYAIDKKNREPIKPREL